LYDREENYDHWEEQPTTGRKRKAEKETVSIDMDFITRKLRRPKMETQEEVTERMRAVELAVKEALAARGESHFTDQEFPPCNESLFVDPDNPLPKLQVSCLAFRVFQIVIIWCWTSCIRSSRSSRSGSIYCLRQL
jgi:hypothetical protein